MHFKLGWNQTKMGLKLIITKAPAVTRYIRLKSDQDGIEILCKDMAFLSPIQRWNQTKMGLKCSYTSSYYSFFDCWNQTKMGLKFLISFLISSFSYVVEIRPRWDWNEAPRQMKGKGKISWNQTKMGLKFACGSGNEEKGRRLKSDQDGIEIVLVVTVRQMLPKR